MGPFVLDRDTESTDSVSMSEELFDKHGRRLYLTPEERQAFLDVAKMAPRPVRTFCHTLHTTGCRISEALQLTPVRIDLPARLVTFETLKQRRRGVYRAVPVPEDYLDTLDMVHGLRELQRRSGTTSGCDARLWSWSRMTGFRYVKGVMDAARIEDGPHKSPKGLRHAYGINAILKGVPVTSLRKWMGHAQLETTAIYVDAVGSQQQEIAARMWK